MFIVLLFLLSLSLHQSAHAMEEKKDNTQESLTKILKTMIDFEDLDGTLKKVTSSIQDPFVNELTLFSDSRVADQWREIIYLDEKPRKICAVGPLVAWLSKKNPKQCFYINREVDHKVQTIRLEKTIRLIDLAPNALKIALTSEDNVEVWNINKFKKVFKDSYGPNIITALKFYRYNKMILGLDNGYVCPLHCSKKFSKKMYHECYKHPNSNNSAITALATITGDYIIGQDLQGVVTIYRRYTKLRVSLTQKLAHKSQFTSILPFGSEDWIASYKGGFCRYKSINTISHNTLEREEALGSLLVGKTAVDTFVAFYPKLNVNEDSGFKVYSFEGNVLKEISVLERVKPVIQKPATMPQVDPRRDCIPGYLVYESTENKAWALVVKETPTVAQLAFRVVLAEAYEQKNIEALANLFAHEQFKSFGNYMQKLLLSEYDCKNKF